MAELRTLATSFTDTFIQGIINGEDAVDSLANALKQLASQLASSAIQQIFQQIFPSPATVGGPSVLSGGTSIIPTIPVGGGTLFHTGGIVTAHAGKRMSDERLVIAQTGEKIVSRHQVAWGGGWASHDAVRDVAHNGKKMKGATGDADADVNSGKTFFGFGDDMRTTGGGGTGVDKSKPKKGRDYGDWEPTWIGAGLGGLIPPGGWAKGDNAWQGGGGGPTKDLFNVIFNPIINANNLPHGGMMNQIVDMLRMMLQSELPNAVRKARQNRDI
jgi:hypothetical protein